MKVRVAVVDDSSFVRQALRRIFQSERRVEIAGLASSGEELLGHLDSWAPDVITLDLSMPGMGGLATLDRIMARRPTPVVILSSHSAQDAPLTLEALHRGAVDFIDKEQYSMVDFESLREALLEKLLAVAGHSSPPVGSLAASPATPVAAAGRGAGPYRIVLIGASTGGPPAIEAVLRDLRDEVNVPIAIVQHLPDGFSRAFAARLDAHLPLQVREPASGELLRPGAVYIAPAGLHLRIQDERGELRALMTPEPSSADHRPSVDVLFASAQQSVGPSAIAVLLTGMGQDGARGMQSLCRDGAMTLAQDEASSVVYGMPRAAVALGAVREVLSLDRFGLRLRQLLRDR